MIARGHKRRLGGGYRCPTPERSSLLAYAQSQLRVPVYTGTLVLRCFRCCALPDHSPDSAPDPPHPRGRRKGERRQLSLVPELRHEDAGEHYEVEFHAIVYIREESDHGT